MESDAALGWAEDLDQDLRGYAEIDELLDKVSAQPGDVDSLRRLAVIEGQHDRREAAAQLLEIAAKAAPEDLIIALELAVAQAAAHRHRAALTTLDSLRDDTAVRVVRADIFAGMGLRRLALAAYGDRRLLDSEDRGDRRNVWWRVGGPLRFLGFRARRREEFDLADWPADLRSATDPALLETLRARNESDRRIAVLINTTYLLMEEFRVDDAVDVLTGHEHSVAALMRLASLESWRYRPVRSRALLAQAQLLAPGDLGLVVERARLLRQDGLHGEELALLEALPPAARRTPEIRGVLGELYQTIGLPALARKAYGDPGTLSRAHRRQRRRGWWRSGGVLRHLLRDPLEFEGNGLATWRANGAPAVRALRAITWPPGFDPAGVIGEVEQSHARPAMLDLYTGAVLHWARRVLRIGTAAGVWTVFIVAGLTRWELSTGRALLVATIAAALVSWLRPAVFNRLGTAPTWSGEAIRGGALGLVLLGGGYALTRLRWPNEVACTVAGWVLLATLGTGICCLVVLGPVGLFELVFRRRHWRARPRTDVLDELCWILDGIRDAEQRADLTQRSWWMWKIEHAAVVLEKRLPNSLYPTDPMTSEWATHRGRGAAAALRKLKRLVIAPDEGSWAILETELRRAVIAMATGEFGRLRWSPPPTPTMVRRSRIRMAITAVKTLALAVVPLVAALALQPWLSLEAKVAQWARLFGFGWAVLYILFAADPTLREKIDTAQRATTLLRGARQPGRDGASESGG
jgi:hypothetical protein